MLSGAERYLVLSEDSSLKILEFPAVYKPGTDELYKVDPLGFEELSRLDGTKEARDHCFTPEFLEYCLSEGIIKTLDSPAKRDIKVGINETPSLRYLMVEITDRCNLYCRHCYLGGAGKMDMVAELFERLVLEFEGMGGLRLIVTGGEPLLHGEFLKLCEALKGREFRKILVTNATLIERGSALGKVFNEVQVSLDGMRKGHEMLRGDGSFEKTVAGIERLLEEGVQLSVATMVHEGNLDELDELEQYVKSIGAFSWALDVPCEAGRLLGRTRGVVPDYKRAMVELERSFGTAMHEPSSEYACGAHLACVKVDGTLSKCGFFDELSGGCVEDGLRVAWSRLPKITLSQLECDCEYLSECGGGCRYRALRNGSLYGPDLLGCARFLKER